VSNLKTLVLFCAIFSTQYFLRNAFLAKLAP